MSVTVKLSQPIQAHGQTVSELVLRAPKGKDIAACGMPRSFLRRGNELSSEVNAPAVHSYIVTLGNIPPSSADQLGAADWMDLMSAVLGFFAPAEDQAGTADPQPGAPASQGAIQMPFQDTTT